MPKSCWPASKGRPVRRIRRSAPCVRWGRPRRRASGRFPAGRRLWPRCRPVRPAGFRLRGCGAAPAGSGAPSGGRCSPACRICRTCARRVRRRSPNWRNSGRCRIPPPLLPRPFPRRAMREAAPHRRRRRMHCRSPPGAARMPRAVSSSRPHYSSSSRATGDTSSDEKSPCW